MNVTVSEVQAYGTHLLKLRILNGAQRRHLPNFTRSCFLVGAIDVGLLVEEYTAYIQRSFDTMYHSHSFSYA